MEFVTALNVRSQERYIGLTKHELKQEFTPLPIRWVVERTFAWFDNDRRLCRDYELLAESSETMVKLAAIKILLKKI